VKKSQKSQLSKEDDMKRMFLAVVVVILAFTVMAKAEEPVFKVKIGSVVLEKDGSYWLREKYGWASFTKDGLRQGSFIGGSLNSNLPGDGDAKLFVDGYGEAKRIENNDFRNHLPGMSVPTVASYEKEVKEDGAFRGLGELRLILRAMENSMLLGLYMDEFLQDGRFDSLELYYFINHYCSGSEMSCVIDYQTAEEKYLMGEILRFATERDFAFSSHLGQHYEFAIFPETSARYLSKLTEVIVTQTKANKKAKIPTDKTFYINGSKVGEKNDQDHMKVDTGRCGCSSSSCETEVMGDIKWVQQIIDYLEESMPEETQMLLRDQYSRMHIPFMISVGNIEVSLYYYDDRGILYQIEVSKDTR